MVEPAVIGLHQFLRSRRSRRRFKDLPVEADILERIFETATYAPNAHNRQPWRFAVAQSAVARAGLAEEMGKEFRLSLAAEGLSQHEIETQVTKSRARITGAPVAVVLCANFSVMKAYQNAEREAGEQVMAMQSVALAGGQMLLAAHAEGLGGVWMCAPLFAGAAARRALNLPETWQPQALLLLGWPAGESAMRARRPVSELAVYR